MELKCKKKTTFKYRVYRKNAGISNIYNSRTITGMKRLVFAV
jgi:hypothetical protein